MYVKCMYACISNHVCEMYVCIWKQKCNLQIFIGYIFIQKNYIKTIQPIFFCFLFTIQGDNRYNGINVHPIGISHITFKFEITTRFTKPI